MGKKKKALNARQRKLVQTLAKGATITEAAIAAGYSKNRPDQSGSQALKLIGASGAGADFLDRMGLTDEVLYQKYIFPLLNAYETKFVLDKEGNPKAIYDVPDNSTRRYMVDVVCRIKGLYKEESEAGSQPVRVIYVDRSNRPPRKPIIEIPTLAPEDLKAYADGNGEH
jgi:hypothetical protein